MLSAFRSGVCRRPLTASIATDAHNLLKVVTPKAAPDNKRLTDYLLDQDAKQAETKTRYSDIPREASYALATDGWKPFRANSFIRPHELTQSSRKKKLPIRTKPFRTAPGKAEGRWNDPFYQLGIDPLDECLTPDLLSVYVTEMAKIKPRSTTRLTLKTQRKLGKAIKRAKMMGVIPMLSRWRPQVPSYSPLPHYTPPSTAPSSIPPRS